MRLMKMKRLSLLKKKKKKMDADNNDDYELPKAKTEEELAEEARTEPNAAEIKHFDVVERA